jgi:hypothetical protein
MNRSTEELLTTAITAATTKIPPTSLNLPVWSGFILLLSSSFFWGSNYLPMKKYETGDGFFYQLILNVAIWFLGFIINCVRGFPTFHYIPVISGVLWAVNTSSCL